MANRKFEFEEADDYREGNGPLSVALVLLTTVFAVPLSFILSWQWVKDYRDPGNMITPDGKFVTFPILDAGHWMAIGLIIVVLGGVWYIINQINKEETH